jgi:Zn-dependent protease/CBS domain-containing protein
MSHSLLARRMGHPVRGITLFVFGGVSEIAEEAHTASAEFWIAVVGPFSSFFLAAFFFGLQHLTGASLVEVSAMLHRLSMINLALGLFNLLPAFPLDGGRVLRSFIWRLSGSFRKATRLSGRIGRFFGYLMIVGGILISFGTGHVLNGVWIAFIGWFLTNAAEASVQQVELHRVLEGLRAKDMMAADCPVVPGNMRISELVEDYILRTGNPSFFVTEGENLTGVISMHEIKQIPRDQWDQTEVRAVMKNFEKLITATPDTAVDQVLQLMDDQKVNQVPVVDRRRLVGIITRERLLNLVRTRMRLQEI